MFSSAEGASQAPNFSFYFDKIYSIKKQFQVFDILKAMHPTHEERLWLAGFLKYASYSCDEVIEIIDAHCEWSDYDPEITQYQVATVFQQPTKHHNNGNGNTQHRRARKWSLAPAEEYRCKYYRTMENHRRIQEWAKENGVTIHETRTAEQFDPAKLGGFDK